MESNGVQWVRVMGALFKYVSNECLADVKVNIERCLMEGGSQKKHHETYSGVRRRTVKDHVEGASDAFDL